MTKHEKQQTSNPVNLTLDPCIQSKLMRCYNLPVMNNVHRSDFVECLVEYALEPDWFLTSSKGDYWAPWDCEHISSGTRIEIKHSAANQIWHRDESKENFVGKFDIAARTEHPASDKQDEKWRPADIYVFAWHGDIEEEFVNQRDPSQWQFYVVAEKDLPGGQSSISLGRLKSDYSDSSCGFSNLKCVVENACPDEASRKVEIERALQSKKSC